MKQIKFTTDIITINETDVPKKITTYERFLLSRMFTEILHDTFYQLNVKNDLLVYATCFKVAYIVKENEYNFICSFKGVKFYLDKIKKTVTIYK